MLEAVLEFGNPTLHKQCLLPNCAGATGLGRRLLPFGDDALCSVLVQRLLCCVQVGL